MRPTLPALPTELTKVERVKPLAAEPVGVEMRIDRAVLTELYERFAEAIGAIERGNNRAAATGRWWRCTDAIFRTGKTSAECTAQR